MATFTLPFHLFAVMLVVYNCAFMGLYDSWYNEQGQFYKLCSVLMRETNKNGR